jgi:competence protein ComEC
MSILPSIAAAFAAGLLLGWLPGGVVLLAASLVPGRGRLLRPCGLAFLVGCLSASDPPPSPLARALPEGADLVRATGTVVRGPDLPVDGRTSLLVEVERVGGRSTAGRVRVFFEGEAPDSPPGSSLRVVGRLLPYRRSANPGERDARLEARRRGISHMLPITSRESCRVLGPASPLDPRVWVYRTRRSLDRRLSDLSDARTRSFLACLILGQRQRVDPRLRRAFQRTGTLHFLAISGLHVGILAWLAWLLLRLLPLPDGVRALLVAAVALAYAGVTGLRPPAARAAILVTVAAVARVLRRRPRALHVLACAALLILGADAATVRQTGFQLSFAAVLSILLLSRPIEEGLFPRDRLLAKFSVPRSAPAPVRWLRSYLRASVPVSLAAWLGTAPIILSRFGSLSLLVVPANVVVFPFVFLLVPLGLLTSLTGVPQPAGLLVHGLSSLVGVLSTLPFACVHPPAPPDFAIVLFYGLLLLSARRRRLGRRACGLLLVSLGLLAGSGIAAHRPPSVPRLTVLSVGHGLATVLETPQGGVLIYDVGSLRPGIFPRVVHPFLRHRRIWRADWLVLSHKDADHVSGAEDLLRDLVVGEFRPPGTLAEGDTLEMPGLRAEVLWPPPGFAGSQNNRSVVLRVRTEGLTVLYTGDAEEEAIHGLLGSGRDLTADVLVLPHHGAPQERAADLVRAVHPGVMIASDGSRTRLDPAFAAAFRTSESGAVTVLPGPGVETFR